MARHPRYDAAGDLEALVRWLPALSGHAICLEPSRSAPEDPPTEDPTDRELRRERSRHRAHAAWRRARELIATGQGEAVAILWTAYGACVQRCGEHGDPLGGPVQHRARCEAVALGASALVTRQAWRTAAGTWRRGVAPAGGCLVLARQGSATVTALAAAWGAEHLAPLWSPAPVPRDLALGLALGWVGPVRRAEWDAVGSGAVRDVAVVEWGDEEIRRAAGVWREHEAAVPSARVATDP